MTKMIEDKLPELLNELTEQPLRIAIEPTNSCNANCSFCANRYCERERSVMSMETYKKALDQIMEVGCKDLKFTPIIGDTFVDPDFLAKVRYAKSLDYFDVIYTFSNMIGAKKEMADDIVTSGLNSLYISSCLQGPEDYKRIYGVDHFETVMSNILAVLKANKKHGFPVDIGIFLRQDKDYSLAGNKYYKTFARYTNKIEVLHDDYDNWSGLVKKSDLPQGQSFRKIGDTSYPCSQFYNGLVVTPSGEVGICWCRDTNMDLPVGNIYENTLAEIWQSDIVKKHREDWMNGSIPDLCKNCLQYTPVTDHSLVHKLILKNMSKYPVFVPLVLKSKALGLVRRSIGITKQLKNKIF
jgi:radical SAM protein with 4Fe4S-binding SPASM domain